MALKSSFRDTVFLLNFPYQLTVGKDAFQRIDIPQPVTVSFSVPYDMESAGSSDKLQAALDYDEFYHGSTAVLTSPEKVFRNIQDLAATIIGYYSATGTSGAKNALGTSDYTLKIDLPKGVLRAEGGLKYEQTLNLKDSQIGHGVSEFIAIEKIRCYCIVGANEYERSINQAVFLDIEVACQHDTSESPSSSTVTRVLGCYQDMVDSICEVCSKDIPSLLSLYIFDVVSAANLYFYNL